MIGLARKLHIPTLVDPKGTDYSSYRGASLITPNRAELQQVIGPWKDEADLRGKAHALRERLQLEAVLLTRSEEGMTLYDAAGELSIGAQAREVVFEACDFDFSACEIEIAGNEEEAFPTGGDDFVGERFLTEEGTVDALAFHGREAEAAGGVALGVEVDEQGAAAARREAGGEVDGGGGFGHAPFLVGDRNDLHRSVGVIWCNPRWRRSGLTGVCPGFGKTVGGWG
jgi:hypothetical protein